MPNNVQQTQDKKAEFSINMGLMIQTLILAAIIGNVKILMDIKDKLADVITSSKVNEAQIKNNTSRIDALERRVK